MTRTRLVPEPLEALIRGMPDQGLLVGAGRLCTRPKRLGSGYLVIDLCRTMGAPPKLRLHNQCARAESR